jgi:hypothetical protein
VILAIRFGMSLKGGPHDDLAANIQLAIQIFGASPELRKFGLAFFMPFEQFGDPLMECFPLLAHECLPLGLAFRIEYRKNFAVCLMDAMPGYANCKPPLGQPPQEHTWRCSVFAE